MAPRLLLALVLAAFLGAPLASLATADGAGLLPDLVTVVPKHLGLQNAHQREILRFSNGIANVGEGDLRMRPETVPGSEGDVTVAIQEVLDASRAVVHEAPVSTFEFHPAHNHWHIGDVARFEVRHALDDGTGGALGDVFVNDRGLAQSVKVTFCLIDWYKLEGNSPRHARNYFDCETSHQGISVGWVDQYHQATDGQQVDVTGAPAGVYYLFSTANAERTFLESDLENNSAWTSFRVERNSNGNPKIVVVGNSPCSTESLCGEHPANR